MSKKVSLKDAFVRSVPSQLAVEPAEQVAVYADMQETVQPAPQLPSEGREPALQPASQPVNPLPVYTASHVAVPRPIPKKKATFNLDASLHQRLKVAAAVHSREMVDIVEDALLKYLPALDHSQNQGLTR